jgi:hypothetical protein
MTKNVKSFKHYITVPIHFASTKIWKTKVDKKICLKDAFSAILRPWKEVPWMVGMTALEVSHSAYCYIPPQPLWPM